MARRGSCRELVGRDEYLAVLEAEFDRARAGTASTVLIGGEAGIGKTRLVTTFGDRTRESGYLVLTGGCAPLAEGLLPYGPVGDAFRDAASQLGPTDLRHRLGAFSSVLELVAPDLTEPVAPVDDAHAPGRPPGPLLLGAFRRLAETGPIVVVSDDLHWADASTLDLLVLLTRSLGSAPVLWIGTYRTDELRPDLPTHMERLGASHLDLRPLSRAEATAQIADIRGDQPSAELVDRIYARSEGNPFFTEELLAAGATASELPANLRQLLLTRVRDLPAPARRVLAAGAVAGRVVDHRLLAHVTDLPDDELRAAIGLSVDARVLVPIPESPAYTFRHALLHEAVASTLLPAERIGLHRRLAEALAAEPAFAAATGAAASAELAHHWLAAGDLGRALAAHAHAGQEAEAVHAMAEAHRHFELAIELWDRVAPAVRADAGVDLAALYEHASGTASVSGKAERAVALLDHALARPGIRDDPLTAGLLHERLGRYLWVSRADEQLVVAMYERAVARVPSNPSAERARVLAGLGQILMLLGHYRRSRDVCEEALAIATRVGAGPEEGHARNTLGIDLVMLGRLDDGIGHLRLALTIAHETGNVEDLHRAHTNLAATLASFPRLDEARAIAHEGLEITRRHGVLATQGAYALSILAEILYFEGRWDDAEGLLAAVTVEPGFPVAAVEVNRVAAQLCSARGRVDEAERLLAVGAGDGTARGDKGIRARLAATRAEHHILHGQPDQAQRDVADAAADLAPTDEGHLLARLAALGLAAATDPIPDWLDRLDRLAQERCGSVPVPPETTAYLAQARAERIRVGGRRDPGAWAEAGDQWHALGRPYPTARCRVRQAEAEIGSSGNREEATRLLDDAAHVAARLGATPLLGAVEQLARRARLPLAAGRTAGGASGSGAHGLSARELEVLALLAEGRTNRQIAETLFISERTAGVHVSHILTKLGVANRGQAAAAARRLGLSG
ncbi:MAG: helix-turn-helix transcriptional regulator [Acidimicrobiales bacterium]